MHTVSSLAGASSSSRCSAFACDLSARESDIKGANHNWRLGIETGVYLQELCHVAAVLGEPHVGMEVVLGPGEDVADGNPLEEPRAAGATAIVLDAYLGELSKLGALNCKDICGALETL